MTVTDLTGVSRWCALWQRLGGQGSLERWHEVLTSCYESPGRYYHTLEHIAEALQLFDQLRATAQRPDEVELAIWTHDVIWEPLSTDVEAMSAAWVATVGRIAGVSDEILRRVGTLILATTHATAAVSGDAALLQDIDLAILGADSERFDQYEADIAAEYAVVPPEAFRAGRRQVLERFLARPTIYSTKVCQERFEAPARANLARTLLRL